MNTHAPELSNAQYTGMERIHTHLSHDLHLPCKRKRGQATRTAIKLYNNTNVDEL